MTEVTVTDYETREVQRKLYECDHCGKRVDEDDVNTANIHDGPSVNHDSDLIKKKHLCNECSGVDTALKVRERRQHVKERWESFAETVNWTIKWTVPPLSFTVGVWATVVGGFVGYGTGDAGYIVMEFILGVIISLFLLFVTFLLAKKHMNK
jgi:hypothetical protein